MMMKIAQKCNLQLLPLPGMFCPVSATVYIFFPIDFFLLFIQDFG